MRTATLRGTIRLAGGEPIPVEIELDPAALAAPAPETVSDRELVERWRCSARTVARLRDRGLLHGRKIGRRWHFPLADVRRLESGGGSRAARRAR